MAVDVEIDASGLARFFERLGPALDANMSDAMMFAADMVVNEARVRAPSITGALRSSIGATPVTGVFSEGTLEVTVSASAPHAPSVEFGAKPHVIRPKVGREDSGSGYNSHLTAYPKRRLRFPGGANGWIFAKEVHHPGNAAQPFLVPALQAKRADVLTALEKGVEIAVLEAKGGA